MQVENILELLYGERKDYKGTGIMRDLLINNEEFRNIIIEGIKTSKIIGFDDELWNKLDSQNLRYSFDVLSDAFKVGHNLGRCKVYSTLVSYSFPNGCQIAGGIVGYLKGTVNSPDGSHKWIVHNRKIYDTTFMITIDLQYSKKLGYIEENIYNPTCDSFYVEAKEFANDQNLRSNKKSK